MTNSDEPAGRRTMALPSFLAVLVEQLRPAILAVLTLSLLTGCIFPLLLFAIARPLFPRQSPREPRNARRSHHRVRTHRSEEFTQPEYFSIA